MARVRYTNLFAFKFNISIGNSKGQIEEKNFKVWLKIELTKVLHTLDMAFFQNVHHLLRIDFNV